MIQDQIPLFIPLVSFSDHCKSLDKQNLKPLHALITEMELKFLKAERSFAPKDCAEISFETLGLRGIHVRLLDAVLKLRLVPLFDWQNWRNDAEKYYQDPQQLYTLDAVTLGKILTVLLRSQAIYGPYFLENKIKDKFVLHLLKALVFALEKEAHNNSITDMHD